jgi:hypothetical protein
MASMAIPTTDATPFSAWSDKLKSLAETRVRQLVPVEPERYNHEEVSGRVWRGVRGAGTDATHGRRGRACSSRTRAT